MQWKTYTILFLFLSGNNEHIVIYGKVKKNKFVFQLD